MSRTRRGGGAAHHRRVRAGGAVVAPRRCAFMTSSGCFGPSSWIPSNGYRRYAPEQLERARLVAWLRRIGMPLAEIAKVVELPVGDAAGAIQEYWRRVEADTEAKRQLAAYLVEYLSGKDTAVVNALAVKYAVRTDRGLVREANQDFAYAGEQLLAVADGFGERGAVASQAAVAALRQVRVGDLLNAMDDAARLAGDAVRDMDGSGTTLTALLWSGNTARARAHRGLAGLSAPRRRAVPGHPRRHARPVHGGRREAHHCGGRVCIRTGPCSAKP